MKIQSHQVWMAILLFIMLSTFSCKNDKKKVSPKETHELEVKPFELKGEEVSYSADTTQMKGYIAYNTNADSTNPGIIVVHEWWGHNDYTRKRADMLAALGYTALAVDMYGNGKLAKHPNDAGKFAQTVMTNMPLAEARFDAAMKVLRSHPTVNANKIAAIGYCFGGSVVLTMANFGKNLDAVAAFHSGVELPIMPTDALKARVLVINGAADPFISKESVESFKKAMDSIHADYEYIAYDGVQHAFTSKAADSLGTTFQLPLQYNAEADEKSWNKLISFLEESFN